MDEKLKVKIKYEYDNSFPSFRNEIADVLEFKFSIDNVQAKKCVWNPFISEEIMNDIERAQHMGAYFWATYTYEELNNSGESNLKF